MRLRVVPVESTLFCGTLGGGGSGGGESGGTPKMRGGEGPKINPGRGFGVETHRKTPRTRHPQKPPPKLGAHNAGLGNHSTPNTPKAESPCRRTPKPRPKVRDFGAPKYAAQGSQHPQPPLSPRLTVDGDGVPLLRSSPGRGLGGTLAVLPARRPPSSSATLLFSALAA